jgi:glycosyltransferase involved in cell wall biosynthesis
MVKEIITVVIPTYNRQELLHKCLSALQSQTLSKDAFEVIVVSDGADSATESAVNHFKIKNDLQVRYFATQSKGGPAGARNLGWLQARAKIIAFTDDDCLPESSWLSEIIANNDGQQYVAFSGRTVVPMPDLVTDYALNTAHLENASFITANCAVTKAALIKVGGFDESFRAAWREDSDLHFKFIEHEIGIVKLNSAIVVHPVRSARWGVSLFEQNKGRFDALLYRKYPNLFKSTLHVPIFNYYLILVVTCLLLYSIFFSVGGIFTGIWAILLLFLYGKFAYQRLHNRHKGFSQVVEIIVTSMLIPYLSIYWRLYGSVKYRVLYI